MSKVIKNVEEYDTLFLAGGFFQILMPPKWVTKIYEFETRGHW
jgi:hypothetical protein